MTLFKLIPIIVLGLALALPAPAAGQVTSGIIPSINPEPSEPSTPVDDPSPNDVRELMRLLADERVRHWLEEQATAGGEELASEEMAGVGLQEWLGTHLQTVNTQVQRLEQTWEGVGKHLADFQTAWARQLGEGETLRSIVYVIVFLIIGAGLEWLYWRYAYDIRRRIEYATYENPERRLKATFTRAMLAALGISLFALGTLGGFSLFNGHRWSRLWCSTCWWRL